MLNRFHDKHTLIILFMTAELRAGRQLLWLGLPGPTVLPSFKKAKLILNFPTTGLGTMSIWPRLRPPDQSSLTVVSDSDGDHTSPGPGPGQCQCQCRCDSGWHHCGTGRPGHHSVVMSPVGEGYPSQGIDRFSDHSESVTTRDRYFLKLFRGLYFSKENLLWTVPYFALDTSSCSIAYTIFGIKVAASKFLWTIANLIMENLRHINPVSSHPNCTKEGVIVGLYVRFCTSEFFDPLHALNRLMNTAIRHWAGDSGPREFALQKELSEYVVARFNQVRQRLGSRFEIWHRLWNPFSSLSRDAIHSTC